MTKEVAVSNAGTGTVAGYGTTSLKDMQANLRASKLRNGGSGAAYISFSGKTGGFTYGTKKEEMDLGTRLAVNITEYKEGWICWKEGKNVEEVMVRAFEGSPPPKESLTDHGPYEKTDDGEDGWQQQSSVMLATLGTEKEQYVFNTSSSTGRAALGRLAGAIGDAITTKLDEDGNPLIPIIELDQDSFQHKNKRIGTIYTPQFNIVDWVSTDELEAGDLSADGDNPDDYEGEDDEPEAEEAPKEKAPARRRASRNKF